MIYEYNSMCSADFFFFLMGRDREGMNVNSPHMCHSASDIYSFICYLECGSNRCGLDAGMMMVKRTGVVVVLEVRWW